MGKASPAEKASKRRSSPERKEKSEATKRLEEACKKFWANFPDSPSNPFNKRQVIQRSSRPRRSSLVRRSAHVRETHININHSIFIVDLK